MVNPSHFLLNACDQVAENENDDQAPAVPSELVNEKPKESNEKALIVYQPDDEKAKAKGKALLRLSDEEAKRSKVKAPPAITRVKDGPKHGRPKKENNDTKLILSRSLPPNSSDSDFYPKIDSNGRRTRRRSTKLVITEESVALKKIFDKFKEQNMKRANRSLFPIPQQSSPVGSVAPSVRYLRQKPVRLEEPWTTEELENLRIGVRNYGQKKWEAMLADPSLKFSKSRSPRDLKIQWGKERSNLLNKGLPANENFNKGPAANKDSSKVSDENRSNPVEKERSNLLNKGLPANKDSSTASDANRGSLVECPPVGFASSSSFRRIDIDLNKPYVSEE